MSIVKMMELMGQVVAQLARDGMPEEFYERALYDEAFRSWLIKQVRTKLDMNKSRGARLKAGSKSDAEVIADMVEEFAVAWRRRSAKAVSAWRTVCRELSLGGIPFGLLSDDESVIESYRKELEEHPHHARAGRFGYRFAILVLGYIREGVLFKLHESSEALRRQEVLKAVYPALAIVLNEIDSRIEIIWELPGRVDSKDSMWRFDVDLGRQLYSQVALDGRAMLRPKLVVGPVIQYDSEMQSPGLVA